MAVFILNATLKLHSFRNKYMLTDGSKSMEMDNELITLNSAPILINLSAITPLLNNTCILG